MSELKQSFLIYSASSLLFVREQWDLFCICHDKSDPFWIFEADGSNSPVIFHLLVPLGYDFCKADERFSPNILNCFSTCESPYFIHVSVHKRNCTVQKSQQFMDLDSVVVTSPYFDGVLIINKVVQARWVETKHCLCYVG